MLTGTIHWALVMGLHNGTGTICVRPFWAELLLAKSDFPQNENQNNLYSMRLSWSDQSDFRSFTEPWPWGYITVLVPSLYIHFELSYGDQNQILSRAKSRKIYIQCTYPYLINLILGDPVSHGHGLHDGTGSIFVCPFWAKLWWAKSYFPQSEIQKNRYSMHFVSWIWWVR